MSEDDAVRATNDDAAGCKRAAVQLGYWKDPYINYFMRASERKAPEINRGFYVRVKGVHSLLKQFLEITKCQGQIVNLGAGFDTTYWNLKDENLVPKSFIEVDFQGVTARKTYYIQHRKHLLDKLTADEADVKITNTDLHAGQYHIVAADLRNVSELTKKLGECGIDFDLPTCFLTECVLVYMPPEASENLLRWIPERFKSAFFVNYEQVNMGDRFGKVMIDNLRARGCGLPGVQYCQNLESQKQRFLSTGWTSADAINMVDVYRSLPQSDVRRVESIEFLDEIELFIQLCEHYAISYASVDNKNLGLDQIRF